MSCVVGVYHGELTVDFPKWVWEFHSLFSITRNCRILFGYYWVLIDAHMPEFKIRRMISGAVADKYEMNRISADASVKQWLNLLIRQSSS